MNVIQYRALAEFRYQIRRFLYFSEEAARASRLEPQQHQLLLVLKGSRGPHTVGHLAQRLQLRHNSTVELVNRMAEHHLVCRSHDTGDKRQVLVRLTRTGERVLEKLSQEHLRELQQTGPALVESLQSVLPTLAAVR